MHRPVTRLLQHVGKDKAVVSCVAEPIQKRTVSIHQILISIFYEHDVKVMQQDTWAVLTNDEKQKK